MVAKSEHSKSLRLLSLGIISCLVGLGCQTSNSPFQSRGSGDAEGGNTGAHAAAGESTDMANRWQGGRHGFNFAQVSLFGDLPGLPASGHNSRNGTSLEQHTYVIEGASFDPAISWDGKNLAFASTQHNIKPDIYLKGVGASALMQLTSDPSSDVHPSFSPDSKQIAFASERTGNWDIFVIDASGGNLQQLSDDPAPEMHPSFSGDGSELTYCRYNLRSGQWEVWVMSLPGGQKRFITAGLFPAFSPTAQKIVYQRAPQRGSRWFSIWQVELRNGVWSKPTEIARSGDCALISPCWSADGKYISFCAIKTNRGDEPEEAMDEAQLWVVREDGKDKMPVSDPGIGCFGPVWSRDGNIYFCSNRGGQENIWSVLPIIGKSQVAAHANKPMTIEMETAKASAPGVSQDSHAQWE